MDFIIICVIMYVFKFVNWLLYKILVIEKVNILKDVIMKMCWIIDLFNFIFKLIDIFGYKVLVCKLKNERVFLYFVNNKLIVIKENFMMVNEINGFNFFIILIVLVLFWGSNVLFVCVV